jgi:hypothetical protein
MSQLNKNYLPTATQQSSQTFSNAAVAALPAIRRAYVILQARAGNTGSIYLGETAILVAGGPGGIELLARETVALQIENLAFLSGTASAAGQVLDIVGFI